MTWCDVASDRLAEVTRCFEILFRAELGCHAHGPAWACAGIGTWPLRAVATAPASQNTFLGNCPNVALFRGAIGDCPPCQTDAVPGFSRHARCLAGLFPTRRFSILACPATQKLAASIDWVKVVDFRNRVI